MKAERNRQEVYEGTNEFGGIEVIDELRGGFQSFSFKPLLTEMRCQGCQKIQKSVFSISPGS